MFYYGDDDRDINFDAEEVTEEESDDLDEETDTEDETDEADDGAQEDDTGDEGEETEHDDEAEDGDKDDDDPENKSETFTVRYRHEDKQLSRKEVLNYAQKGMDYDRKKQELDSLNEEVGALRAFKTAHEAQIDELTAYMQEIGATNIEDVLDALRVSARVSKGESSELAKANVRAERLERRLSAGAQQKSAQAQKSQKAQEDIAAFQKDYPDVPITQELLQSLSDDLKATGNLTRAYERKQRRDLERTVADLKKQLSANRQNADNKRRSTGSQRSAGGKPQKNDPLLAALLSDD